MASRKFLSCRHTSWFQTLPAGPRCCRLPLWQGLYMNHMQLLRPVIWSLIVDSAKAVVHVFISCRLDYYNSLLTGVTDGLLCRLSSRNAAVRLVLRNANTSPRYGGSCAGCQFSLQRIHYKLATITFRALSGEAPVYLGDGCQPVANSGWRTTLALHLHVGQPSNQSATAPSVTDRSKWLGRPANTVQTRFVVTLKLYCSQISTL